MRQHAHTWALVLAGGDGSRLQALTRSASGASIPKQFCSLHDGPSLLHEALLRARQVATRPHTCVVVAEAHRRWWEPLLCHLPGENVIAQPANRGTALGILLPLLHILERDPSAHIVIFPADHHVSNEPVMSRALQQASEVLQAGSSEVLLLGLEPEETDPELGYIVPTGEPCGAVQRVREFVEKPSVTVAQALIEDGALWNAFILAAAGDSLLELFRSRLGALVDQVRGAMRADLAAGAFAGAAIAGLYRQLSARDFSRDVLTGAEARLRVLAVPRCGWTDLGTPRRVAEALRRIEADDQEFSLPMGRGYLNLAAQIQALQRTSAGPQNSVCR